MTLPLSAAPPDLSSGSSLHKRQAQPRLSTCRLGGGRDGHVPAQLLLAGGGCRQGPGGWLQAAVGGARQGCAAGERPARLAVRHQARDQLRGRLAGAATCPDAPAGAVEGHRQPAGGHGAAGSVSSASSPGRAFSISGRPASLSSCPSLARPACCAPGLLRAAACMHTGPGHGGGRGHRPHPSVPGGVLAIGCALVLASRRGGGEVTLQRRRIRLRSWTPS